MYTAPATTTKLPWEPTGCMACCSGTPEPSDPLIMVSSVSLAE